jgi:mannose-6-phosphate isomerase-like protein (cupin superfamily)
MVLCAGTELLVTLMTIPVGEDIGLEVHPDIDRFLCIEQGEGRSGERRRAGYPCP